jgi:PAS domain S-box-containing protein
MRKSLFLFIAFLFFHTGYAQVFQFNRLIKGLDLPSDNVFDMVQDDEGKMWFNTGAGVFYSDGFSTYGLPDYMVDSLSDKIGLLKDGEGKIWIYNQTGPLKAYFLEGSEWVEVNFPKSIQDLASPLHVQLFVKGKAKQKAIILQSEGLLAFQKDDTWDTKQIPYSELGLFQSVFPLEEGHLLLFRNGSLLLKDGELSDFHFKGLELPAPVSHIAFNDHDERFYFLGKDFLASGLAYDQADQFHHTGFVRNIYSLLDYSGLQIVEGDIYYHYNSHLHHLNPESGGMLVIDAFDELKSYNIYHALVDRENILWIGSHRGVLNIKSLRFQNFKSGLLLDDEVTALLEFEEGKFILGFNNGIQILQGKQSQVVIEDQNLRGQPRNRITNFSKDRNGIIWFSSNLEGLGRFEPQSRTIEYAPSPLDKFVTAVAAIGDSLFVVSRDRVYLSSIHASVKEHFNNDITRFFTAKLEQEEVFFRKVDKLKDGRMVFMQGSNSALKNGIIEFEDMVSVVGFDFLDMKDSVLYGTETGLRIWKNDSFKLWEVNGQVIQRPVYALLKDSKGNIWAGTDKGVYKYDGQTIRNLDEKSGLSGSEINRGAFKEGSDGRIYIGTQRGLSIYDPEEDKRWNFQPKVKMGGISFLNAPEQNFDLRKIPFEQNSIKIDFDAVTFLQVDDLVLKYKLEGYHEGWIELVNPRDNSLIFNNLPAGDYQLFLRAGLRGLDFSEVVLSEKFTIRKPLYLQTWFVILVLLVFLGIGFLFSVFLSQLKRQGALKQKIDQKTEEAKVSDDQFRNVWKSSQDGLVLSVEGGKVMFANPAMAQLAGVDLQTIKDPTVSDLFTDPDYYFDKRGMMLEKIKENPGTPVKFDLKMPFKAGVKDVEFYITKLSAPIEGKAVFLSVFRDITDKKKYEKSLEIAKEKAEESSRLKSSFLSNMSHEIRTPLNGILGTAENIIMERQEDAALISQLEIIHESGERLLQTINSILDLSKIEANKMEVLYRETNLNDFLSKLLVPLKPLALKKGLLIRAKYETKPFIAATDQRYFEMIVNNLVGNAIKYSEKGVITITLKSESDKIYLEVKDEGVGINEEFLGKLFEPFEQESRGYGRSFEGTGLGLVITKNLVQLMKGEIKVKSKKGQGTSVIVFLPVDPN